MVVYKILQTTMISDNYDELEKIVELYEKYELEQEEMDKVKDIWITNIQN